MNKVFLVGTVASVPELRFTQAGQAVLNFRVATKETWFKDGAQKEKTDWHSVVCWGKRGEDLATILMQEMPVVIEGKLQTSTYDDSSGKKCYKTDVNASNVEQFSVSSGGGGHSVTPAYPSGNPVPFGAPAAPDPYAAHNIDPMTMY